MIIELIKSHDLFVDEVYDNDTENTKMVYFIIPTAKKAKEFLSYYKYAGNIKDADSAEISIEFLESLSTARTDNVIIMMSQTTQYEDSALDCDWQNLNISEKEFNELISLVERYKYNESI